jgi:pimeloyl-ACP methyl ester carboxylesterase
MRSRALPVISAVIAGLLAFAPTASAAPVSRSPAPHAPHGNPVQLAAAAQPTAPSAASRPGALQLNPCVVTGIQARCGTFVVPEDRAKPNGRKIGLRVVVLPATSKPVATDAVAYLAGGPGAGAASEYAWLQQDWPAVNAHHDILLVDQRGTGASNAHACPSPTEPLSSKAALRAYTLACLKAFDGDASQYGTRMAMDDLDAVRAALGYRQLDVFGASYGSTAAQVYLKLHPSSVRTLTLLGGTALDVPFFGRYAVNAQRALDQWAKLCASQPACRQAFPNWERQFGELVKAWDAHPVQIRKGVTMTGAQFAAVVHGMLADASRAPAIPLVVSSAAKGDYAPLNQAGQGDMGANPLLMYWSIWCNEPWAGLDANGPWGTAFDSYTTAFIAQFRWGCTFMPKRAEPRSFWTFPSSTRVPVLAITGDLDPQDPITNLPDLKRNFPDSRAVILAGTAHELPLGGCIDQIEASFIDSGTTRDLDTGCAATIAAPPFRLSG